MVTAKPFREIHSLSQPICDVRHCAGVSAGFRPIQRTLHRPYPSGPRQQPQRRHQTNSSQLGQSLLVVRVQIDPVPGCAEQHRHNAVPAGGTSRHAVVAVHMHRIHAQPPLVLSGSVGTGTITVK